jgi:hypothetical protein
MAYVDDVHFPQFPSDLACEAAEIDAATLKNWISRKPTAVMIGNEERIEVGDRTSFRFTLRRVLQLAITSELVRLGYGPRDASLHAAHFTDIETTTEIPGRPNHRMGELFSKHYTLLIVYSTNYAEVVNVKADDMWRLVLRSGIGAPQRLTAATIVNLNEIDRRVRTTVGLPLTVRQGVL